MQSKISVLQVIPQLDVSGASQGCIDVANYLINNNHSCVVMTHSGKRLEDARNKGIEVIIYDPLLEADKFFNSEVVRDLIDFKSRSEIIIANRRFDELSDVSHKIFTRDIFGID